jgi:hypothetical protein
MESDAEFVERVLERWNDEGEMIGQDMIRLFALARRGAAAGELAEALRMMREVLGCGGGDDPMCVICAQADAAIVKFEGQTQETRHE